MTASTIFALCVAPVLSATAAVAVPSADGVVSAADFMPTDGKTDVADRIQRVIDEYPGTPFADDAAIAITQLGMTPEELVRMFEEADNGEPKTEN